MAEDSTNPSAKILDALQARTDSINNVKGVRKDTPTDKVKPDLDSPEISRFKKIFSILKDIMNPGPEAKRLESTKAASSIGNVGEMQKSGVVATIGSKKSWLKMLLLALGVAAAAWLAQFIDDVTAWGIKMLLKVKVWFKPLTNIIRIISSMGRKFGRFIKGLKPVLKIVDKVAGWFKGLTTAIKGSKTVGGIMKVGGSLMTIIKTAGQSVGKTLMKFGRFLPWIGSLFSFGFAIAKYIKGDLVGGTLELVSGIINLLPGGVFVSALLDGYILYRDFTMGKEDSGVDPESGEPGMLSKIWTSVSGWFSENYKNLPIIGGIVKMGEAAGHLLKGEWLPGFRALSQIIPSWLGGSIGGDLAGKGFDFVMGLFGTEGSIDYDSINTDTDNSFSTMVGNMFSSIGDILGNIWGGIKNKVTKWKDNVLSAVGNGFSFVFGGGADEPGNSRQSKPATSMGGSYSYINDGFISKNGKVTAFNDQDNILFAKSGGPIDKLLNANSAVMAELNNVNKNQLNVLISIRDGISTLVSRNNSGSTTTDFSNNPLTEQFYANNPVS